MCECGDLEDVFFDVEPVEAPETETVEQPAAVPLLTIKKKK